MLEHLHTNSKADRFEIRCGDAKKELAWTAAPIHCDVFAVLKGERLARRIDTNCKADPWYI